MILIIRDETPEEREEVIEVWLERDVNSIHVMSKSSQDDQSMVEVNIHKDRTITLIGHGNFKPREPA